MPAEVVREVRNVPLDDSGIEAAAQAALEFGGRPDAVLSIVLVDDATLAELHDRCLGDPTPTDVMSFDLGSDDEPHEVGAPTEGEFDQDRGPDGEVVVSVDRALLVAADRGVPAARELALYVVHGTLHLCGFDDHDDADRAAMRAAECAVLSALGYDEEG